MPTSALIVVAPMLVTAEPARMEYEAAVPRLGEVAAYVLGIGIKISCINIRRRNAKNLLIKIYNFLDYCFFG